MHDEICPYCNKNISVSEGRIRCPECNGEINVFDPAKRAQAQIDKGLSAKSLIGHNKPSTDYRAAGPRLHEGHAGGLVSRSGVAYTDVGGLDEIIQELDLLVAGPTKYRPLWQRLGMEDNAPRGILLVGPPGCGKTLLVQALASESRRKCAIVQGAEVKGWRQGASEGNLVAAYESVRAQAGILIIDEVDAIGGRRESMVNETNVSLVSTLCSILDGARGRDGVTIIGTTNKPNMLDVALRRPGRFDLEIAIPLPNTRGRQEIFTIHTKGLPLADDIDLAALADRAHGFSGADIAGVCSRIRKDLLRQAIASLKSGAVPEEAADGLVVTQIDFIAAITATTPSLLRDSHIAIIPVQWNDIGGLMQVKEQLMEMVSWPLLHAALIQRLGLRQPKGMLLYGPPGCGKTMLGQAIATESEYNCMVVNGPALLNKWVGSTEEAIRDLFYKARLATPCVIFLDEVEAIAPRRGGDAGNTVTDRAVSQLLAEMDGAQGMTGVFVVGATNRPELVDPALLRPGRLDLQFEVPKPDEEARQEIFGLHLHGAPLADGVDLPILAQGTAGCSGADIEWICTLGKKAALRRHIAGNFDGEPAITQRDLEIAAEGITQRL